MEGEIYLTDVDINSEQQKTKVSRQWEQSVRYNNNFWKKTLLRVNNLRTEDYYENKKLRPGINFYKVLLESYEQGAPNIGGVRVNLPETLCMQSNRYNMIFSKGCSLQRLTEVSFQDFEKKVVPKECRSARGLSQKIQASSNSFLESLLYNPEYPLMICRSATGINFTKHIVTVSEYKMKQIPTRQNQLYQKYILPYDLRANLIRIHFFTKNSRSQNRSIAYKITNITPIFKEGKQQGSHTLTINFDRQNSFQYVMLKGKCLEMYENMAESVIRYLQQCKDIVVREAVFDFTIDYFKTPWLIGLKMVRFDNRCGLPYTLTAQEKATKQEQIMYSVNCRLCGVAFRKDGVKKILTNKLLFQLVQHIKKRGKHLPDLRIPENNTIYCKVCNLCYSLVVAEHNLINIEQEFSMAQNIIHEQQIDRIALKQTPLWAKPQGRGNLLQWRMMIYLEEVIDVQPSYLQQASKIFFQFKIHTLKTKFQLPVQNRTSIYSKLRDDSTWDFTKSNFKTHTDQQQTDPIVLKKIKVQYMFSKTTDISSFLNQTEIKFRMTYTSDWNDMFAEGSSKTINHFKNLQRQGQRHSNQVLMFYQNKKYSKLQIHMGLVCDGEYSVEGIPLTECQGVYFPTDKYYNCNPFPDVWMEIFEGQSDSYSHKLTTQPQTTIQQSEIEKYCRGTLDELELRKLVGRF